VAKVQILAHRVFFLRILNSTKHHKSSRNSIFQHEYFEIVGKVLFNTLNNNEEALDELTLQLLANKSINQCIIPDFIERDIYKNCLRLVFRLIDKVANTISIGHCGRTIFYKAST
jgi:hypothetical protein